MSNAMAERRIVNMRDMQNEARGLLCPKCASPATEVTRTERGAGVIIRERRCLHCKHRLPKSYETF